MTLTNQDFTLIAGDSARITIEVLDQNGASLNLTGVQAEWVLTDEEGFLYLSKSIAGGSITVANALGGVLEIRIAPGETDVLYDGRYLHELELTDTAGDVATVTTGEVILRRSHT